MTKEQLGECMKDPCFAVVYEAAVYHRRLKSIYEFQHQKQHKRKPNHE